MVDAICSLNTPLNALPFLPKTKTQQNICFEVDADDSVLDIAGCYLGYKKYPSHDS